MTTTPGDDGAVLDDLIDQAVERLSDDARELAAQALKAAKIATSHGHGYLGALVNMDRRDDGDGRTVVTMDVTRNALNGYGYVHGGMLFTLADYAMGFTTQQLVGDTHDTVTLEAKANYLENVREGRIVARTEALHRSKRLVTLETRIHDLSSDQLLMIVTGTFYLIPKEHQE
jgi:acyl-CoA thioesterase